MYVYALTVHGCTIDHLTCVFVFGYVCGRLCCVRAWRYILPCTSCRHSFLISALSNGLCFPLYLTVDPCKEAGCNSSCLVPANSEPLCYCVSGYALDEFGSICVGELFTAMVQSLNNVGVSMSIGTSIQGIHA